MAARVILEVIAGPLTGKSFTFEEHDTFVFGRSEDCQARLEGDNQVSRHHFIMEVDPPEVTVRDLGSRNGTFVDGKKIGFRDEKESPESAARRDFPTVTVADGGIVKAGATQLRVKIEREPEPPRKKLTDISPSEADAMLNRLFRPRPVPLKVERQKSEERKPAARDSKTPPKVLAPPAVVKNPEGNTVEIPGYHVEAEIGRGGFGIVFRATAEKSKKQVAIKVAMRGGGANEAARKLFEREVENIRGLRHPGIVRLLDSGVTGRFSFLVMEMCEGGSLFDLVRRRGRPIGFEEARQIMLDTTAALGFAHESGVVHRDIKPSNLLFSGGRVLVGDFGLAKRFRRAGLSGMTITGHYAGTVHFMPREQLLSFKYTRPVSDVWSLAATFYFMLTGSYPYDFPPKRDPIGIVLNERIVPIERRRGDLPNAFVQVIGQALSVRPKERFQDAVSFSRALQGALAK